MLPPNLSFHICFNPSFSITRTPFCRLKCLKTLNQAHMFWDRRCLFLLFWWFFFCYSHFFTCFPLTPRLSWRFLWSFSNSVEKHLPLPPISWQTLWKMPCFFFLLLFVCVFFFFFGCLGFFSLRGFLLVFPRPLNTSLLIRRRPTLSFFCPRPCLGYFFRWRSCRHLS